MPQRESIFQNQNLPDESFTDGDTHHLWPLQTMISYALSEPFDLISSEHDRHHLLLFRRQDLKI